MASEVISLLQWDMCEEHHGSGGAGCKLLTVHPHVGERTLFCLLGWFLFFGGDVLVFF